MAEITLTVPHAVKSTFEDSRQGNRGTAERLDRAINDRRSKRLAQWNA
jgi:hypothetical protein